MCENKIKTRRNKERNSQKNENKATLRGTIRPFPIVSTSVSTFLLALPASRWREIPSGRFAN